MISRRSVMLSGAAAFTSGAALLNRLASAQPASNPVASSNPSTAPTAFTPVITPNGGSLPWTMDGGVKVFHLVAEPVKREFAPGMIVDCWGYNGQTPGPTIEAVEGDKVRLLVTNHLPEPTSVHWHGIITPNGMDGVAGLTQPAIAPGETVAYEFVLRQHGTQMYHPHSDEMTQMALGMQGFFIIHPKEGRQPRVDRDFCIFLQEWFVEPGTSRPNPTVMTDFNLFTFNSRVWPGTEPLVARLGQRVRIRFANLSMDSHPIHLHGHRFFVTGTDAGDVPASARWPENTANVPVGTTRDIEFVADNPGDWPLHCHKNHHAMNAMGHNLPNAIGTNQKRLAGEVQSLLPEYMVMGEKGMGDMGHMHMPLPKNTLPMMAGQGQYGPIEMGGMFTILKIRENLTSYADPGWYHAPPGTVAWKVSP
jgi:FtsP/CotA-like multicopper oxidase with cupredoxin domain